MISTTYGFNWKATPHHFLTPSAGRFLKEAYICTRFGLIHDG